MVEWPEPRWVYAPLLGLERRRLLEAVDTLGPDEWLRPSSCPGWTVLGLATHLVGDDLSFVAWQRDRHVGTPAPPGLDEQGFIAWLDNLQIEWVDAARRLSPRLVVDLLGWLDEQVVEMVAGHDPGELASNVSWASAEPAPRWLDHARELSERWIHRQQILESIKRPADLRPDLAEPVLDGMRWAYRYRLDSVRRTAGTRVDVAVTGPDVEVRWSLTSDGAAWRFGAPADDPPIAALALTTDQAWRLLSNNLDVARHGEPVTSGDSEIVEMLLQTRAIIGMPQ
jgi:uncharacterized protein (TIGR03083 family)